MSGIVKKNIAIQEGFQFLVITVVVPLEYIEGKICKACDCCVGLSVRKSEVPLAIEELLRRVVCGK
jgi:hypothetical protein